MRSPSIKSIQDWLLKQWPLQSWLLALSVVLLLAALDLHPKHENLSMIATAAFVGVINRLMDAKVDAAKAELEQTIERCVETHA